MSADMSPYCSAHDECLIMSGTILPIMCHILVVTSDLIKKFKTFFL